MTKILNIFHCEVFQNSFNRPNLFYEIRNKSSSAKDVTTDILSFIKEKFPEGCGIVYCFSCKVL